MDEQSIRKRIKTVLDKHSPWWSCRPPEQGSYNTCSHGAQNYNSFNNYIKVTDNHQLYNGNIPELFFESGTARGIKPCFAPGEIIESPVS